MGCQASIQAVGVVYWQGTGGEVLYRGKDWAMMFCKGVRKGQWCVEKG